MPKLSIKKIEKIQEQIIFFMYSIFPKQVFTVDIAREIARDEEFTKKILFELEKKELIIKIDKNSEGITYEKRLRWRISNKAYEIYNAHQKNSQQVAQSIESEATLEQNSSTNS
jgi:hypothetical protein